jgi:peptidoglycan/LPS O-acetylase OafA/YrhL
MAVVRYKWMFRTAAVVYLLLGLAYLWRFGLTDYQPQLRPLGLALGGLGVIIGVFLFRRAKFAIVLSASGAAIVSICAAVFAPNAHGPAILFLALLAILMALYTALAVRALSGRTPESSN